VGSSKDDYKSVGLYVVSIGIRKVPIICGGGDRVWTMTVSKRVMMRWYGRWLAATQSDYVCICISRPNRKAQLSLTELRDCRAEKRLDGKKKDSRVRNCMSLLRYASNCMRREQQRRLVVASTAEETRRPVSVAMAVTQHLSCATRAL
jgi:hypothetical protein